MLKVKCQHCQGVSTSHSLPRLSVSDIFQDLEGRDNLVYICPYCSATSTSLVFSCGASLDPGAAKQVAAVSAVIMAAYRIKSGLVPADQADLLPLLDVAIDELESIADAVGDIDLVYLRRKAFGPESVSSLGGLAAIALTIPDLSSAAGFDLRDLNVVADCLLEQFKMDVIQ